SAAELPPGSIRLLCTSGKRLRLALLPRWTVASGAGGVFPSVLPSGAKREESVPARIVKTIAERGSSHGAPPALTHMSNFSRRDVLKTALSGATMAALPSAAWPQSDKPIARKGNIKQSVSRWCYQKIPLDKLCQYSAHIGLKAVDLLEVE